ncbi:MAG TPA: hypothetical protein VM120_22575, partial [Bryobacteraceae bacterium]|nr:hypothetical protein [Bryobacteraceae bacterium]
GGGMNKLCAILILLSGTPQAVFGYEVVTHSEISRHAVDGSVLSASLKVKDLGLDPYSPADDRQQFPSSEEGDKSIRGLIEYGARFEDTRGDTQALRHFFNPLNGSPLDLPIIGTWRSTASPDWALADDPSQDQPFSYRMLQQYFYDALTKPYKVDRDLSWGRTFQTLGHVIHHLQDMAQPQHVRNDMHCDAIVCALAAFRTGLIQFYHPSRYEKWAKNYPPANSVYAGYLPVYSQTNSSVFTTPRKFWTTTEGNGTGGKGIAEYTNRGFFSIGTIANSAFPLPEAGFVGFERLVDVCAESKANDRPCPFLPAENDMIAFYGNTVVDSLRDSTDYNRRALTASIFDEDLKVAGSSPVFSLNSFNFDAAYTLLLPRAVAYSAGLINYFFRGKLAVTVPEPQGVFSIVDQLPDSAESLQGFKRIKVQLHNDTPDIGAAHQGMTQGTLVAVAKFHRDELFVPDSSTGTYLLPRKDAPIRRSAAEVLVTSKVLSVGPPGDLTIPSGGTPPVTVTFEFDADNLIPINAIDLSIQFVYRGDLGEEAGAVVVQSLDVSEPTLVTVSNDLDYEWDSNGVVGPRPYQATDTKPSVTFVFDSGQGPTTPLVGYSVTTGPLAPGQYVGAWVLVDKQAPPRFSAEECNTCLGFLYPFAARRVETPLDGSPTKLVSPPPVILRGINAINGISFHPAIPESAANCGGDVPLADCLTKNGFPAYTPLTPSGHVTPKY